MSKRVPLTAAILAVTLGLGGCSLVGSNPKPTPTETTATALAGLVPNYSGPLTAAVAKTGTVGAADAIQALIAGNEIVHVDDQSKLVAATGSTGAFYGVERAVTTSKGFDAISQAIAMERLLVAAGWTERSTNTATSTYSVQLTAATNAGASALFLQADTTPGEAPVILLEIESPDLPKK